MSDNPIYSDFWLEKERYSEYIDPTTDNPDSAFSIDLIQLASVRRVLSNYVDILTGMSVPVYFKAQGDSYNVGGKEIYISTEIRKRKDFDQAVGLALHEAAHTLLSDFDVLKSIPFHTPKSVWEFGRKHHIHKTTLEAFIKTMTNLIEDWYVDDWVISRVPGYIGYYEASYNVCFNTTLIDQLLLSNEYRYPSFASYKFRLINFPNPLTDLQALPGLEEIAKTVSISTISRLPTTKDRVDIAFKVVDIVLKNLKDFHEKFNPQGKGPGQGGSQKKRINVNDFFKDNRPSAEPSKEKTEGDQTILVIANTLGQKPQAPDEENKAMASQTSKSADKELPKEQQKAVSEQIHYVNGDVDKKSLSSNQKNMLDLIEKHGIVLVYVPCPVAGNEAAFRVGCIVVKKLTIELIQSGREMFPMTNQWKDMEGDGRPEANTAEAVKKGILLGTKLGKRILIRRECNPDKEIRRKHGKINKRLLYSAGFDAEDIFEIVRVIKYSKGSLHITVDASSSMGGKKWYETMTMCVAICKATSMVDNVHVTVSFRATKNAKGIEMPYIVLAYDSAVDKFSKVKQLFPYLSPCGCTPEGLAFSAIMALFTEAVPDEEDRYFLNISDGEPCFSMRSPITGMNFSYGDGNGVEHTRSQVNKIRKQGIHILSYYVQEGEGSDWLGMGHNTKHNFRIMYGRDAKFIRTDSVVQLAQTINGLFLKGQQ